MPRRRVPADSTAGTRRPPAFLHTSAADEPAPATPRASVAANAQHTTLPGQDMAARLVKNPAERILALDESINDVQRQVREAVRAHPQAKIIESTPETGPIHGAGPDTIRRAHAVQPVTAA
jgi:hypothetical protein